MSSHPPRTPEAPWARPAIGGRVAYGTLARLIGRLGGGALTIVALHFATHWFGPTSWGQITVALAWVGVFGSLGGSGIATLTMREIARPNARKGDVLGNALLASGTVGVLDVLVAASLGVAVYWTHPEALGLVLVLLAAVPMSAIFVTSGSALAGAGRSDLRGAMDVTSSLLLLGGTLVVVGAHLERIEYGVLYDVGLAISAITTAGLAIARSRPLRFSRAGLRGTLRASLPLGQVDLLASVYARADSLLLFFLDGASAVALYGVAFQVATFVMASPSFFTNALAPEYMAADGDGRQRIAHRSFDMLATAALPLPFFAVVFSRPFVIWLGGRHFAGAGPLLAILSFAAAITLFNALFFQLSVLSGQEGRMWRYLGVVTAVNLVGNAVAIPLWGAKGAAGAMVASELSGMIVYSRPFRRAHPGVLSPRHVVTSAAALAVLVGGWIALEETSHVGPGSGAAIVPRAIVLAAVYALLVAALTRLVPAGGRDASVRQRLDP